MRITLSQISAALVLAISAFMSFPLLAEETVSPLRLSYIKGQVSFLRDGSPGWIEAQINTPLVTDDSLYTGSDSMLELQGEHSTYIRADSGTELTLKQQSPDYLQIGVRSGRVALDLPALPNGKTIEIDTPATAFTVDRPGYYRAEVGEAVKFSVRRGGHVMMAFDDGGSVSILSSYEVAVPPAAQPEVHAAAEPDA